MKLTTTFSRKASMIRSDNPLSEDQMRSVAPSIFAEGRHASRSERYTYIPTIDVLRSLHDEGFEVFMAAQGGSRIEGKEAFTKHMLRLRHVAQGQVQGQANEIILINSHDGCSAYQMLAGIFRFVCCNGMVCGDVAADIRIPHKGNVQGHVVDGACKVIQDFERVDGLVEQMRARQLNVEEQIALAQQALALRFGTDEQGRLASPVGVFAAIDYRRPEDSGHDLWTIFNRLQESLVRGGLHGRSANARNITTRPIVGIDSNLALNRALWALAERFLKGGV